MTKTAAWFALVGIALLGGQDSGGQPPPPSFERSRVETLIDELDAAMIGRDVSLVTRLIADSATIRLVRCSGESKLDRLQFSEHLTSTLPAATSYIRVRSKRQYDMLGEGRGGVFRSGLYERLGSDGEALERQSDEEIYVTVVDGKLKITSVSSIERCGG